MVEVGLGQVGALARDVVEPGHAATLGGTPRTLRRRSTRNALDAIARATRGSRPGREGVEMRARQVERAEDFLAATEALRAHDPVRTNVLGSVATGVVDGRRYDAEHWWVVEDADGEVVGAAIWTLPYRLLLAPMPPEAADALAADVRALGHRPPGIIGPPAAARRLAETAGWSVSPAMHERILVLEQFTPATGVPGSARRATTDDVDLGAAWFAQFSIDAGALVPDPREAFVARLTHNQFWMVDGEPVAVAGHAPLVVSAGTTVARVGPVFTPAEHRRQGYGAAITSAVVAELLTVADVVMLFTDAANPTSNGVYERLGFRPVDEVVDLDVLGPA
jgi:predicted GNAT family acetyltransferase